MTTYRERMARYAARAEELKNKDQSEEIRRAAKAIKEADCVIIGAGAGLSAADGMDFQSEEIMKEVFPYLYKRGFKTLWEAHFGFLDDPMAEFVVEAMTLKWMYYEMDALPIYFDLKEIMDKVDYFIYSTNIDDQFEKAGYRKDRLFCPQNSFTRLQCRKPCCRDIWDAKPYYDKIWEDVDLETMHVPEEDMPVCPHCGGRAVWNLSNRDYFIPDEVYAPEPAYQKYLEEAKDKKVVFLELGIGFNTPNVIRHPFERYTRTYPNATLIRVNRDHPLVPEKIKDKSIELGGEMSPVMRKLKEEFLAL